MGENQKFQKVLAYGGGQNIKKVVFCSGKIFYDIKEKINNKTDLKKLSKEINELEKKITLFHAKIIKDLPDHNIDIIGFHGQTIFHNADKKITRQIGNGQLLSQLTQKKIIYNFRENGFLFTHRQVSNFYR